MKINISNNTVTRERFVEGFCSNSPNKHSTVKCDMINCLPNCDDCYECIFYNKDYTIGQLGDRVILSK